MRSTIICVDDEKMLLNILAEQLGEWFGANYNIEKALSGDDALEILDDCLENNMDVSVVISDYIMPNMKGDVLLSKVRERDDRIKKIMLTGYSSIDGIVSAINNAGLYRYITKPWDSKDLMLTVLEAIRGYENEKRALEYSKGFENLYHKYENNFEEAIQALVSAVDARDPLTSGHSKRVAHNAALIGRQLKMNDDELKNLEYVSLLHDIGKIGMKDTVLMATRGLKVYDDPVYNKLQADIALKIVSSMNSDGNLTDGIKYHFEWYNGEGHYKLKANEIPFKARIVGFASFFDIVKSEMIFEKRFTPESIIEVIDSETGRMFDPMVVQAFKKVFKENTYK